MDPARSRSWKAVAQGHALDAVQRATGATAPPFRADLPLEVYVLAIFACPTTDHRKQEPRGRRWHTKAAGDADNLAKAALDAGNGVLWLDDRQVSRLVVEKLIAAQGEAPRVELVVQPLRDVGP
jgi:Holliday junction resolvase RusA-like endonuclease